MKKKYKSLTLLALVLIVSTQSLAQGINAPAGTSAAMYWISQFMANYFKPEALAASFQGLVGAIQMDPTIYCMPNEARMGCKATGSLDRLNPYFIELLVPLYIVALLFTAAYFIVKSTNARGRARAKSMLWKLLYSILIIGVAPILYQFLIDVNAGFVDFVLSVDPDLYFLETNLSYRQFYLTCCLTFMVTLILFIAQIIASLRYFLVVFFGVFFPFMVFLYFFDLTRGYGRKWLKFAVNWIFTPTIQAFFLVFTVSVLKGSNWFWQANQNMVAVDVVGPLVSTLMAVVGVAMIAISPLMMNKLLDLIGGGLVAIGFGSQRPWVVAIGGLLQGNKESAFTLAASTNTRAMYASYASGVAQGGIGGNLKGAAASQGLRTRGMASERPGGGGGDASAPAAPSAGPTQSARSQAREAVAREPKGGGEVIMARGKGGDELVRDESSELGIIQEGDEAVEGRPLPSDIPASSDLVDAGEGGEDLSGRPGRQPPRRAGVPRRQPATAADTPLSLTPQAEAQAKAAQQRGARDTDAARSQGKAKMKAARDKAKDQERVDESERKAHVEGSQKVADAWRRREKEVTGAEQRAEEKSKKSSKKKRDR